MIVTFNNLIFKLFANICKSIKSKFHYWSLYDNTYLEVRLLYIYDILLAEIFIQDTKLLLQI